MQRETDPEQIKPFLTDASNFQEGSAEGVVFPETEENVISFLSQAYKDGTPVTLQGKGTGLTAARVPLEGWAMEFHRMNSMSEIQPEQDGFRASITVGPGVLLKDIQAKVAEHGWLYPPDPTSFLSFIGGNVATNASGGRGFKYGSTRDYINRLRVVLASGDVLDIRRGEIMASESGRMDIPIAKPIGEQKVVQLQLPGYEMPPVKHAAGYFVKKEMDAIDLFIGSEGTLGVVTEIELGLIPAPAQVISYIAFFADAEDAIEFAFETKARSRANQAARNDAAVQARALEYIDGNALSLIRDKYPEIPESAQAAIVLEQECQPETQELLLEQWSVLFENHRAFDDFWVAETEEEHQRFKDFRHEIPLKVKAYLIEHGQRKIGTDYAVPDEHLQEMMEYEKKRMAELELFGVSFGHIGDSHIHLNILPKSEREYSLGQNLYAELIRRALKLGGTVAAEHGVGKLKAPYLLQMFGPRVIREMVYLKKAFDPKAILGRGTMFAEELLTH